MKRNATLILLVATVFFHLNAKAYAQGITIKVTDVTLDKVFSMIQKQTSFVFVYSGKQLAGTKKVSVNVVNEKLEKVMEVVMDGQPLKYEIDKEYVIIKQKAAAGDLALNKLPGELTGKVTNEKGEPVAGATVTVKNSNIYAVTDANGNFTLKGVDPKAELVISSVSFATKTIQLAGEESIVVRMAVSATTIETVVVKGSTGYQQIDRKHPGSFDVIGNELINRSISSNILNRLENLTPGILMNKTVGNYDPIIIRGRNSINSNVAPLIILDNFPYDGNIDNINPNDIESVTVLKDAASASIWGAAAGNGVIVITSKKGKGGKPLISINSSFAFQPRPDLLKTKVISSADFIEVEKFLFEKGAYNSAINNKRNPPPLTPIVEILARLRNGEISTEKANEQIELLKKNDVRRDLKKYFYRDAISLQNSFSISGNSSNVNYYFSAGWDKAITNVVGRDNNRVTIKALNTFRINEKINVDFGFSYAQNTSKSGNLPEGINSGNGKLLYPYAKLVDESGAGLPLVKDFRQVYVDTVGAGKLLDWKYRPFNEIKAVENESKTNDVIINVGVKYKFFEFITASLKYQFESQIGKVNNLVGIDDYSTRNIINRFYQPNSINNFPIPVGGIMTLSNNNLISHQGRFQLNFDRSFAKNYISALVGAEIKKVDINDNFYRLYGYQRKGSSVTSSMDFVTRFPQFNNPSILASISNSQSIGERANRFLSYFVNANYTYDNKYTIYASAREDAANIFGVRTNQKGVPLWSIGGTWQIDREQFFRIKWLQQLKARASYGFSGNYNSNVSALTTIYLTSTDNGFGAATAQIANPPNEDLRWERNGRLNIGIDFSSKNSRISGTIEYYLSRNQDLISATAADPTLGTSQSEMSVLTRNSASIKGKGWDISIVTENLAGKLSWSTNWIFSYASTKVTKLHIPVSEYSQTYVAGGQNPTEGKPMFAIYSYRWAGLDPTNGDPRGYLGKEISSSYTSIINNTKVDSLIYHGQGNPPVFGAVRNTFLWKNFSFSFNISYKLNFYFRRNSIAYTSLLNNWTAHGDYSARWQKAGDENKTYVPSYKYPASSARDAFYLNSEVLVNKGDHIRIEDFQFSYLIQKNSDKSPFQQIRLYSYVGNLNLFLWKANKSAIDPNFGDFPISGKNFSLGISVTL